MPFFGAHMSISGGLELAFERISRAGGESLQIFSRNQRQWRAEPISDDEARRFTAAWRQWGNFPVAVHDSYLINLASTSRETAEKSIQALAAELERTARLGVPWLVMHPGSHLGAGVEAGLRTFKNNLDKVFQATPETNKVMILLETTAGQGTGLGADFNELAFIINESKWSERLGVCLDTCHIFAAGYDFRTPGEYRQTFTDFDQIIGLEKLKLFHLNDSKKELGSRVDRHEHIGRGKIGLPGFALLVNDPRFASHPMILETPKSEDPAEDRVNLTTLRNLLKS